ncbi:MAG: 4a-hydroxytetrahydrobiopterin dehydratase [Prosthecobacter sp.]|nr:4a-hydroxytetrahydrobiopterin dehydratase [Prosthecobacter sp.]
MPNNLLPAPAIEAALINLPGWAVEGAALFKTYAFPTYLDGIHFVDRLALVAEKANHHPDLQVGWRKVKVALSTHSQGGITVLDIGLAQEAERVAAEK